MEKGLGKQLENLESLQRRVDGRVAVKAKPGPLTVLMNEEEEKLFVSTVLTCVTWANSSGCEA